MSGRGGVDEVIFKLNQQAEIVLRRVALGVEMGIGNLGVTTDRKGSVCVEHSFSPTKTGKKLRFLILSCESEKSRMRCPSLLVNKVDGSLLQQCRGSDVSQVRSTASSLNAHHKASTNITYLAVLLKENCITACHPVLVMQD